MLIKRVRKSGGGKKNCKEGAGKKNTLGGGLSHKGKEEGKVRKPSGKKEAAGSQVGESLRSQTIHLVTKKREVIPV